MKIAKERFAWPPRWKDGGEFENNATNPDEQIDIGDFEGYSHDQSARIFVPAQTIDITQDMDTGIGHPGNSLWLGIWACWDRVNQQGYYKFSILGVGETPVSDPPTVPSGWTYRYVASVRVNSSGNLRDIKGRTKDYGKMEISYQSTITSVLLNGQETDITPVDCSAEISPASKYAAFSVRAEETGSVATVSLYTYGNSSTRHQIQFQDRGTCVGLWILLNANQQIGYKTASGENCSIYPSDWIEGVW